MTRTQSKDVLAVIGMLCVDATYREAFFMDPRHMAHELVGALSEEEEQQIDGIAGNGTIPDGMTKEQFVASMKGAVTGVYAALTCPVRPCPREPYGASAMV